MTKKTLSIHSENILPIIKKWLYSEKDIFLRELISNSCDAISKLKLLQNQESLEIAEEFCIHLTIDKEKKTITITDNGIGMTQEEVEKYIAQIAFSGAEDFLEKYKESEGEKDQIIGHFGLGFYSSYMVSDHVDIDTLSYQKEAKPVFWSCDGSSEYTIEENNKEIKRGTSITLHINEENEEFLEEATIKKILTRYCPYLPYPIYLNDEHINNKSPLWLKSPADCTEKEYLDFYKELYPTEPDPIFWVHLNVDYPFNLKGILFFPKIGNQIDINKSAIKLFCNRVFVSDNCKDILPDYLVILRGAIDSPDIPLNVSRSYLQIDKTVKQLGTHISKKIADRLSTIYRTEKEKFYSSFKDIEMILKLGILQDEKFYDRTKSFLIWKNISDEWTTLEEYLERNKEKNSNKIFYTHENTSSFLDLYKENNIEVLITNSLIDTALIGFLENKLETKFQRIDGAIDQSILDTSKEKSILDQDGKSEAGKIADFIRSSLNIKELEVEAKSLAGEKIHGFLLINEEERRLKEYFQMTNSQNGLSGMPMKRTFIVNTNNSLIMKAQTLYKTRPETAQRIIKHLYDAALFSQKEMDPQDIPGFINRSTDVIEELSKL